MEHPNTKQETKMKQTTTNRKFVSDAEIQELVLELAVNFEFGWTSVTPVSEMLPDIKEACQEKGFPNRHSLHLLIARLAKVAWQGRIMEAQTANGFVRRK